MDAQIKVTFDFLNNTYTEEDDLDISSPRLYFSGGSLTGIYFRTDLTKSSYPDGSFIIFYPDQSLEYSLDASSEFSGSYTIQNNMIIPETKATTLLGVSATLIIFRRRRR